MLDVLNWPAPQVAQTRSKVAEPSFATYCPGLHDVLETQAVAALPSLSHLLAPHACRATCPPGQKLPAEHGVHTVGEVDDPPWVCSVPAAQEPWGRQAD